MDERWEWIVRFFHVVKLCKQMQFRFSAQVLNYSKSAFVFMRCFYAPHFPAYSSYCFPAAESSFTNYHRKPCAQLTPFWIWLSRSTLHKLYCSQIYSVNTLHLNAHHLLSKLRISLGIPDLVKCWSFFLIMTLLF